jgi:hypothetical protein
VSKGREERESTERTHVAVDGLDVACSAFGEEEKVVEEVAIKLAPALRLGERTRFENLASPEKPSWSSEVQSLRGGEKRDGRVSAGR